MAIILIWLEPATWMSLTFCEFRIYCFLACLTMRSKIKTLVIPLISSNSEIINGVCSYPPPTGYGPP